jgi:hypothetical protein
MIGYIVLAKRLNATEDGYDYTPISELFTDPLDADYWRGGVAPQPSVEYVVGTVSLV